MVDFGLEALDNLSRSESGAKMDVRQLDGSIVKNPSGSDAYIELRGVDSGAYKAEHQRQMRKRLQRATRPGQPAPEPDYNEIEADSITLLVACGVGWNLEDPKGKAIPFSAEAMRQVMEKYPIIRDQVDRFIIDRANFLPPSSSS